MGGGEGGLVRLVMSLWSSTTVCPTHTGQFSVLRVTIVGIYTIGRLTKELLFSRINFSLRIVHF